eukprot:gene21494-28473_t
MTTNLEARSDIKKLAGGSELWSPADFTVSCGIDVGSFNSHINPSSGRIEHRGKVMNRAARISTVAPAGRIEHRGKVMNRAARISTVAPAGRVYISSQTWESAVSELGAGRMIHSVCQLEQGKSSSMRLPRVNASLIEGEGEGLSQTSSQSMQETAEKDITSANSLPQISGRSFTIRLEEISGVGSSITERVKTRPTMGVQIFNCIKHMRIEALPLGHFRLKGIEEDLQLMSVKYVE